MLGGLRLKRRKVNGMSFMNVSQAFCVELNEFISCYMVHIIDKGLTLTTPH